jgi:hypothetical protein
VKADGHSGGSGGPAGVSCERAFRETSGHGILKFSGTSIQRNFATGALKALAEPNLKLVAQFRELREVLTSGGNNGPISRQLLGHFF